MAGAILEMLRAVLARADVELFTCATATEVEPAGEALGQERLLLLA